MSISFFKNKKFRYGAASIVFTAVVLALIITINVVFSLFASNEHWYVDMTSDKLFTLSDTSKMLLDEVFLPGENGKTVYEGDFTITFLREKDKIESGSDTEGVQLKQVHELALDYAAEYKNITIKYVDMYAHPAALESYRSKGASLYPTSVVFDNGKGLFRVVTLRNFFAYDSGDLVNPIGFYGEHRITSTILSMCNQAYIAYVITGHGEDELSEAFTLLLESCGYTLKTVNLLEMEDFVNQIAEDQPRLVVINNPKYEFVGAGQSGRSEVILLSEILSGRYTDASNRIYASLMLFADPDKGCANENLNSLLTEWGLTVYSSTAAKVRETPATALDSTLTAFFPSFVRNGLVSALSARLASAENYRPVVNGAGIVKVQNVEESTNASGSIFNSELLICSGSAENELGNAAGGAVLALSQRKNIVSSSIERYNYAVVATDASIISEEYLNSASYSNEALMISLVRMTTNDREATPEALLIEYKDYIEETNVQGVSNAGKQAFFVIMAIVVPLIVLGVGIVVYVRRRNRI